MIKVISSLFAGFFVVFKHLFKKPVTLEYPEECPKLPETHRGVHCLDGCIGCGVCQKVCPANAIKLSKQDNKVVFYNIDLNKCIFCGQCQYHCPVKAIKLTGKFDLATDKKERLILNLLEEVDKGGEC